MNYATLLEEALEERGNAVMVIARPADGEDAVIQTSNASFARIVGQRAHLLIGLPLKSLRRRADDPVQWSSFIAAIRTLTPLQLDLKLRVDGREVWLGFGLTFKTDAAEGASYGILIGRDITQARRRTAQDNESQRLLASVFLRTSAPVTIVRPNGAILMANPAFQHLLDYSAEEVLRLNVGALTEGKSSDLALAARSQQLRDGRAYEIRIQTVGKRGVSVPVRLTSVLLRDADDQSLRVVTLLPDYDGRAGGSVGPAVAPAAAAGPPTRSIGEVQAISLAAFKTAFGEAWPRLATRAMMVAEHIIKRRLGASDVFNRSGDHGFVVWFAGNDDDRNAAVLARAAREIRLKFLTEFGEAVAAHVSAVVVGEPATERDGVKPTAPDLGVLHRMSDKRQQAGRQATALMQALREAPAAETLPVTDRDRKVKPLAVVDFPPAVRLRLIELDASGWEDPNGGAELDLLRFDLAARELRAHPGLRVLTQVSWTTLTAPNRRASFDKRLATLDPPTRANLTLAVSGVPPFPTAKRWSELVASLGRQGEVGLMVTLAEGDDASPQESAVADWPVSLLVIDASSAESMPPDGYYGVTAGARLRDIPVLVRYADARHMRDWHELGATMFAASA